MTNMFQVETSRECQPDLSEGSWQKRTIKVDPADHPTSTLTMTCHNDSMSRVCRTNIQTHHINVVTGYARNWKVSIDKGSASSRYNPLVKSPMYTAQSAFEMGTPVVKSVLMSRCTAKYVTPQSIKIAIVARVANSSHPMDDALSHNNDVTTHAHNTQLQYMIMSRTEEA